MESPKHTTDTRSVEERTSIAERKYQWSAEVSTLKRSLLTISPSIMKEVVREPGCPVSFSGTEPKYTVTVTSVTAGRVNVNVSDCTSLYAGIVTDFSPLKVTMVSVAASIFP